MNRQRCKDATIQTSRRDGKNHTLPVRTLVKTCHEGTEQRYGAVVSEHKQKLRVEAKREMLRINNSILAHDMQANKDEKIQVPGKGTTSKRHFKYTRKQAMRQEQTQSSFELKLLES